LNRRYIVAGRGAAGRKFNAKVFNSPFWIHRASPLFLLPEVTPNPRLTRRLWRVAVDSQVGTFAWIETA